MRVILLGPPGSGKGTQGELIREAYRFPRISTGDLLRQAVQERTPLGREAEATMNRGDLVGDEVVIKLVKERILQPDCRQGYILDGFPRTLIQAQTLENIKNGGSNSEVALEIFVEESTLMKRLSGRRTCSKCGAIFNRSGQVASGEGVCDACGANLVQREDDRPEVIRERLRVYWKQTEPLAAYYMAKGVFHRVDGDRSIEAIFEDIRKILNTEMAKGQGNKTAS